MRLYCENNEKDYTNPQVAIAIFPFVAGQLNHVSYTLIRRKKKKKKTKIIRVY